MSESLSGEMNAMRADVTSLMTNYAVLSNDVGHLKGQMLLKEHFQELIKPLVDEQASQRESQIKQSNQLERLTELVGDLTKQASKTGSIVDDILEEKHKAALAAAEAETAKAREAQFWNRVNTYVLPFLSLIGALAAGYGFLQAAVYFMAHPK